MFKYNIIGNALRMSSSLDKQIVEQECSNDLQLFKGMKLLKASIDGKHNMQSRLEFVLQSHQTEIKNLEIKNCIIDLRQAQGQFEDITFTNAFLQEVQQINLVRLQFLSIQLELLQVSYNMAKLLALILVESIIRKTNSITYQVSTSAFLEVGKVLLSLIVRSPIRYQTTFPL
ncbi:Hypothetical_protein [Hexamita inflata]|uniref:Hypothetical_protein n=1 Tax=Hexamita inflata TaxID=28002 RepID=A0AA86U6D8_9EUKA|nr:Hypothetical protein HINF_LOCUS28651 [Hexamita inflata]